MPKFPQRVLVHWERPQNGEPYMVVNDATRPNDAAEIGETRRVAVYVIEKEVTVRTKVVVEQVRER